jgi:hypothetical protein
MKDSPSAVKITIVQPLTSNIGRLVQFGGALQLIDR